MRGLADYEDYLKESAIYFNKVRNSFSYDLKNMDTRVPTNIDFQRVVLLDAVANALSDLLGFEKVNNN